MKDLLVIAELCNFSNMCLLDLILCPKRSIESRFLKIDYSHHTSHCVIKPFMYPIEVYPMYCTSLFIKKNSFNTENYS